MGWTRESSYQRHVMARLSYRFPGCFVTKNNPKEVQGIPDLLVLYGDRWGMLEVKLSANEAVQPNQEWYVEELNAMSFAAFIYPENEEEVLDALQQSFESPRTTRVSKP